MVLWQVRELFEAWPGHCSIVLSLLMFPCASADCHPSMQLPGELLSQHGKGKPDSKF